jgi:hypothetical protein
MADYQETHQAIMDAIYQQAQRPPTELGATGALRLAEALAWLTNPAQPHGGSPTTPGPGTR